jgi:UDP-N-acetylglucosamine:LPS N-acetylglucosamine transferase
MKKIIIFTSSGGGGHTAAATALKLYLSDKYNIQEAYIFRDVLQSLDFVKLLTFGYWSDEQFFNSLIKKKRIWALAQLYNIGNWYINKLQRKRINPLLHNYLTEQKPDLVISIVPLINRSILDVTESLSIPFIVIPTDLDTAGYLIDIKKPIYNNFFVTQSFNEPSITQPFIEAKINPKNIIPSGFLIRPQFFEEKNISAIKKDFNIPPNKPVVSILMGSRGNNKITRFIQELAKFTVPLHILAFIGTNETERKKIEKINLPTHISLSIIGFTDHISDLLALTDLLITKTGPNTVCEALYMNVPCLLDLTGKVLPWEQCAVSFVQKNQYGTTITSYEQIASQVKRLLKNKDELIKYKNNIEKMEKKNAGEEIRKLIDEIL